MMSTTWSTASEKKLLHYSTIRKEAQQGNRDPCVEVEQILLTMAMDLRCEDRYVVYACQRAFAAILKTYKLQDLSVIQDILQDWSQVQHHTVCQEICSELLSRHCKHCQFYAEHLSKPLSRYSRELFRETDHKTVFVWNTSSLYCLLKIYYKYTKLVRLFKCADALRFIQTILYDFKSTLIDILFNKEVPEYIGRRLLRLLCSLFRCDHWGRTGDLYSEILHLNDLLIKTLNSMDLEKIVCKSFISVFTGRNNCTDPNGHTMDMVHLREWSFFIVSSLALKCSQGMSTAAQILNRLDVVVKKTLGLKNNILLSWIAKVFCDQDDKWIELLLVLMNVSLQRSMVTEWAQIKNHWYFLQFMFYTVFDHLVLIDFLTSPETSFLQYLTCYLKYLLSSWTEFQYTVDKFEKIICLKQPLDIDGGLTKVTDSKIQTKVKDKSVEQIGISGDVIPGKNLHGLGMISKTYSDSDDTDSYGDDIDDDEIDVESAETENVDLKSCSKFIEDKHDHSVSYGVEDYCYKALSGDCSHTQSQTAQIRDSGKGNVYDVEPIKLIESVVFKNETCASVNIIHCETVSDRLDKSVGHITKQKTNKTDTQRCQIQDNVGQNTEKLQESDFIDSIVSNDSDLDRQEIHIMDSVMSTLIRVRLKLESLWENDMIGYNPNPLMKLLLQIENVYENS